jgi:hypothetical protein
MFWHMVDESQKEKKIQSLKLMLIHTKKKKRKTEKKQKSKKKRRENISWEKLAQKHTSLY